MNKALCVTILAGGNLLFAAASRGELLYYDGQGPNSTFVNTAYDPVSLSYTMSNGQPMPTDHGKRTTPGTGDPSGNDYVPLNPTSGSAWDLAGFYDPVSGTIGGGNVSGDLYVGFLLRAHYAVNGTVENKGPGLQGAYAGLQLDRTAGGTSVAMGNHWGAWAYSIFGTPGERDLRLASGGTTYISYNSNVHWMVAKITFNPGAADDITVWLDPNPDHRDTQNTTSTVRYYSATGVGDLSFDDLGYRSGNIPDLNSWDFDEVRIGTDWAALTVPEPSIFAMLLGLGGIGLLGWARRRH